MNRAHVLLFSAVAFAAPAWGQSPSLLFDFSRVQHQPSEVTTPADQKIPAGTVELVDGQFGKACRFSFVASTGPQFFTAWVNPTENWDQYEGFSFSVKGDGSKSYGGLEFIDGNDYALRFGYCFPIESNEWFKVSVPWSDLVPELAAPAVDAKWGFAPSRFRNVWIGKWHYWREYLELAVDRVRRVTKGQADVLLMTTCPGFAAWETRNELCVATYEVAQERQTGFVDAATVFHKAGSRDEALRRQYWV